MTTPAGTQNGSPRKKLRTHADNKVSVVLGSQWGDEGKGKVVDMLATAADIVCRFQVSAPKQNTRGTRVPGLVLQLENLKGKC